MMCLLSKKLMWYVGGLTIVHQDLRFEASVSEPRLFKKAGIHSVTATPWIQDAFG
jgi:hypothetical protein